MKHKNSAAQPSAEIKMMKVKDIEVKEPFSQLFPIDPETLERIKEHMKTHGYDMSQSVPVWRGTLLDGHTRLKAVEENGIEEIPVCEKDFVNEDEAIEYAIHNQVDRRNLTDGDILRLVEKLDSRYRAGRPKFASSEVNFKHHLIDTRPSQLEGFLEKVNGTRSSRRTARMVGTSCTKVEKVRTILEKADSKTKEAILKNEISINRGYHRALKKQTSITLEFGNGIYLTIKENDEFPLRNHMERIDWLILGTGQAPDIKKFPRAELLFPKSEK